MQTVTTKRCNKCGEEKPLGGFYSYAGGRLGVMAVCKECKKAYSRAYGKTEHGQEVRRTRLAAYFKENQDRIRLRKYGITPEDYKRMFKEQKGLCAICKQPERAVLNGRVKALCVDHNHETGEVRRLLCLGCNVKLGWLETNLDVVLDYLNISIPTNI